MMNEDTLVMTRPTELTGDPIVDVLFRIVFFFGLFVGAALFALGVLVGVVIS